MIGQRQLISIKPEEENMFRKLSVSVVAVALLMLPAQLMAGGPPRLCLPINNVTPKNAEYCSKRIAHFLGERASRVALQEHEGQWYATIAMRQDINLMAVHDALAGSRFSVPREKLTLIGPARLSITVRTKFLEGFFSDLAAIDGVTIEESSRDGSGLLVTINESNVVRKLDEATGKAQAGPSYDSVRELLAGHNAELADVSWSSDWGCRMFGCLATRAADAKTKDTVAKK
jgi:hypothetical protein